MSNTSSSDQVAADRSLLVGTPPASVAFGGSTHVGMVRESNQDFWGYYVPEDPGKVGYEGLYIVCDGMGGHAGGETASLLAVEKTIDECKDGPKKGEDGKEETLEVCLRRAVETANGRIFGEAQERPELRGMGSTITALVLQDGQGHFAQVGDSRGYVIRGAKIRQITKDHSLVQQLVDEGLIDASEMETHPDKNVILRSLGVRPAVEVDLFSMPIKTGDIFMMCSDGLSGLVSEEELLAIIEGHRDHLDAACEVLIDLANSYGGHDNITLEMIKIGGKDAESKEEGEIPAPTFIPSPGAARAPKPSPEAPAAVAAGGGWGGDGSSGFGGGGQGVARPLFLFVGTLALLTCGLLIGAVLSLVLMQGEPLSARDQAMAAQARYTERLEALGYSEPPSDELKEAARGADQALTEAVAAYGGPAHLTSVKAFHEAEGLFEKARADLESLGENQARDDDVRAKANAAIAAAALQAAERATTHWHGRAELAGASKRSGEGPDAENTIAWTRFQNARQAQGDAKNAADSQRAVELYETAVDSYVAATEAALRRRLDVLIERAEYQAGPAAMAGSLYLAWRAVSAKKLLEQVRDETATEVGERAQRIERIGRLEEALRAGRLLVPASGGDDQDD